MGLRREAIWETKTVVVQAERDAYKRERARELVWEIERESQREFRLLLVKQCEY